MTHAVTAQAAKAESVCMTVCLRPNCLSTDMGMNRQKSYIVWRWHYAMPGALDALAGIAVHTMRMLIGSTC